MHVACTLNWNIHSICQGFPFQAAMKYFNMNIFYTLLLKTMTIQLKFLLFNDSVICKLRRSHIRR